MKLRVSVTLLILINATVSIAANSPLPAQILCTPDEHTRVGIDKSNSIGSEAQLFVYGGKITMTKDGASTSYSYGQGQDFYRIKEKSAFFGDFLDFKSEILLVSDPGWADSSSFLILMDESYGNYFYIDWDKRRYYGYVHDHRAVDVYAGPCKILKN